MFCRAAARLGRVIETRDVDILWREASQDLHFRFINRWRSFRDEDVGRHLVGSARLKAWWSAVGQACPLIVAPAVEDAICEVRRNLLRLLVCNPSALPSQSARELLFLAEALGAQGQQSEHAYMFSDEELEWVQTLSSNGPVEWQQVGAELLEAYPSPTLHQADHQGQSFEDRSIVRNFYERYPYPQWKTLVPWKVSDLADPLREAGKAGQTVLVAGCGTGRWACHFAATFPRTSVIAVDVSRNSLAFAKQQKRRFDLQNISFQEADLRCWTPPCSFDFIECGGVLHHLDDPVGAWSRLISCLNPAGVMLVALYSRMARWPFKDMREKLLPKALGDTCMPAKVELLDDQIARCFRREVLKEIWTPELMPVARCADFHSLARLRDCFFHPLEHEYTLLELRDIIKNLDLKLMQLDGKGLPKMLQRYQPGADINDLGAWHQLEERMPGIFIGMYRMYLTRA